MVMKILFLSLIILFTSGCIGKKEIQLDSLSIVTMKEIEDGYLKKEYLKYNTSGSCILKFNERRNQLLKSSDTFLKIDFISLENVNIFQDRRSGLYVWLSADGKGLEGLSFCPLVEKNLKGYRYSYFYPISYKIKKEYFGSKKSYDDYGTFNLKKVKELRFKIETVGYSRWKTNEIVITRKMIDKLKL